MNSSIDFLNLLRRSAEANDGRPLGEAQFYRQTGLSRKDLWAAGYDSYGAAREAAGLRRNTLTPRLSDDELLRPLALLARQRGMFPPKGAIEVARTKDPAFPSWEAFKRRENQGPEANLREVLVAWCNRGEEFADVAALLRVEPSATDATVQSLNQPRARQVVMGYVYLMRYGTGGRVYKIGRSENVLRRHAQLNTMTPQDMRIVHAIPTDDPEGIESYWKRRFDQKRLVGKNELFRLAPEDVAAFRARKYQ